MWLYFKLRALIAHAWKSIFHKRIKCIYIHTYIYIYIYIYIYLYIYIHIYIYYMYIYIYIPICIYIYIPGRAHCFHNKIYIMLILLLWDFSTLCVVDHLWQLIYIYIYMYVHINILHIHIYVYIDVWIYRTTNRRERKSDIRLVCWSD